MSDPATWGILGVVFIAGALILLIVGAIETRDDGR